MLLVGLGQDLVSNLEDEAVRVGFFEHDVRTILVHGGPAADGA